MINRIKKWFPFNFAGWLITKENKPNQNKYDYIEYLARSGTYKIHGKVCNVIYDGTFGDYTLFYFVSRNSLNCVNITARNSHAFWRKLGRSTPGKITKEHHRLAEVVQSVYGY